MTTEAAATEAANEASFDKGFAKVSPSLSLAAPDAAPAPAVAPKAEPAAPAAPVKDEWEGVQPAVRTHLETISGRLGKLDKIEQDLKTTVGRVGALQKAVDTAKTVKQDGGAAPSQEQIQSASQSGEKWKALLESFPDFKEGLEERFNALDARLKQQTPFDKDGFKNEIVGGIHTLVTNSSRELREFAKLDSRHDGWEDTINTPQFAEWAFTGGPTAVEQAQWRMLKSQSPDQAEEFFKSFEQRHPQWWKEKGSLMASSTGKDAIGLLDGYKAHTTAVSDKTKREERNAQRLEGALTPRSAGAPPGQPTQDDEASFQSGFKRVAKK